MDSQSLMADASRAYRVARINWRLLTNIGYLQDPHNSQLEPFQFEYLAGDDTHILAIGLVPVKVAERIMDDPLGEDILPGGDPTITSHNIFLFDTDGCLILENNFVRLRRQMKSVSLERLTPKDIRLRSYEDDMNLKGYIVMFRIKSEAALRHFVDCLVAEGLASHAVQVKGVSMTLESN